MASQATAQPSGTSTAMPKKDEGVAIVVSTEVERMINAAFDCQDDIENASKFARGFLFDAVKNHLRYTTSQAVNKWDAVVKKVVGLHPTLNYQQAEAELLVSRTAQEMKARAVKAAALKATL